jgi:hypothetical protein
MAITITGSKENGALNAVGTTTVTVSGTPFASGTYASARRIDLYNSAGTTFKGMAFVRKWNSTSQLELETEFFDPKTGATVTQVSGDTVLVSKNWADVVQAGIAISNNVVTVSDTITFGQLNTLNSVAFHDENLFIVGTVSTNNARMMDVAGGFVTFGHLQNWATKAWYAPCSFYFANTNFCNGIVGTSTSARFCQWGGAVKGSGANPIFWASGAASGSPYGTDWAFYWSLDVQFDSIDIISYNGGGDWTTGANHILENCSYVATGLYAILLRWGNGSVLGGQFKIPRNSSDPISIFGSDANGTYEIGAPIGQRAVVLDLGNGNTLWRSDGADTQTINCTNLISTDFRAGTGTDPAASPNANATKNVYFLESYANLQDATKLAIIRDSDWSSDDTDTSSGSASSVSMRVFHSTGTGNSMNAQRGPWTYRIRKYGYDEQEGAIAESDYSLGTAGTAKNVSFGGSILQIADTSLTDSEATALAYAGITVTDHGASPVTWNSKDFSITVEVDLTTYPTRTAAQVFAHVKAKIASLSTWGGKAGILWHVLMEESNGYYVSQRGKSGGAGATLKGVRIIDQAGNSLPGVTGHVADDGTTYVPPAVETRGLEFTGLVAGSFVRVVKDSDESQLFADTNSSTTETWSESATGSLAVSYVILKAGYEPIGPISVTVTGAVTGGVVTVPVSQVVARWYQASSGLTINTNAFANATTKKFGLTTASTLQNFVSYLMEQWIALGGTGGAFANKAWPVSANGPNSFTWLNGWEADLTNYANTITNLSRDGMRYLSASNVLTASWCAVLSVGVSAGMRVRFQQSDGGTTQSAAVTSGNIDQLIQIYGDATHGNFDRTGYMVAKVQEAGYDQAEVDVVAQYGTLEDQLYVIGLAPTPNGIATGDPRITGVTITDHGASPVSWNGLSVSLTITDSGTNSGTNILRWLRHNFEAGGTFQSKDGFNWHDLVQTNGSNFKTVRGKIYGDTGATLKGVRVLRGSDIHPDFDLFTGDDGTTYSPPVVANADATVLANTRIQLYNVTQGSEIENVLVSGTSYSKTITTEANVGDTLRLTAHKIGRETAIANAVWSTSGVTFLVDQPEDTIYTAWGIDGSTVSEFTLDVSGTIEIDANDADGSTTKTRLGAWYSYILTTENGIRNVVGAITAVAVNAIRINVDVLDLKIENTNATTALRFTDNDVRLYRSDGTSIIQTTSYSIHNDYSGVPDVVETGVSGLTGAESAQLFSLTNAPSAATVAAMVLSEAQSAPIYAEIRKVAGSTINGSGTENDPWGPT